MDEERLRTMFLEHLRYYTDLLLGPDWALQLTIALSKDIPTTAVSQETGSAPMTACDARVGERKIRVWVNKEINWDETFWNNPEVSAAHEILHIVLDEQGFSYALHKLVGIVSVHLPVVEVAQSAHVHVSLEEFIDRIATVLMRLRRRP